MLILNRCKVVLSSLNGFIFSGQLSHMKSASPIFFLGPKRSLLPLVRKISTTHETDLTGSTEDKGVKQSEPKATHTQLMGGAYS